MSRGRPLLHQPRLLPPAPLPPCLLLLPLSLPSLLLLLLLPSGTSAAVGPIYWNASNPQFQMDHGVIVFPKMGDRLDIICPRLPGAASASASSAAGSRVSSSSSKKSLSAASSSTAAGGSQIPSSSKRSSSSSSSSDHDAVPPRRSAGNMMDLKESSRVDTDGDEKDDVELQKKVEEVEEEHGVEGERYRLYMVGRDEARDCDARRARNALLTCDRPGVEVKYTIKFQEYSPSVLGLEFRSGRDYYIISTSTGTLEGLDQLQGGVCETLRMKVVLHVGQDPGRSPRREEEGEGHPAVGATDWEPPWDKGRGRAARPELGDAALSGETHDAGVTESFPERRHSLLSGSGLALIVGAASGILIIFLLVLLALVACRLRRQRHHHQQHHQQQQQQQQHHHHQLHNSNNISSSGMPSNNYQQLQHHLLQQQQHRQQQQHHHQQQQHHHQQQHHQLSRSISISTDAMLTRRDYAHARTLVASPVGAPLPSAPPLGKEGGISGIGGAGGAGGDVALLQCPHYEKISGDRGHPVYIVQEGVQTGAPPHSPAGVYYRV